MVPGVDYCWLLVVLYDASLFVREAMILYRLSQEVGVRGDVARKEEERSVVIPRR